MGQITADQSQAVMATLIQNTDWSKIDFDEYELQDKIICDPQGAGRQFALFLKNVGQVNARSVIASRGICTFAETDLLRPVETLVALGEGILDEDAFFRSREGEIRVSPSFRERFRRTFRKSRASNREYVACELKLDANDTAIRADLPESHLSELGDIARLIKGGVLSRDRVYVAYVEDENKLECAVSVAWHAGDREWFVFDCGLDELGGWHAGYRVLCPSNATL
jgi:hypothetical protein